MEELGDLRCTEVAGLGWLGQRTLPSLLWSPDRGTRPYARRRRMASSVLRRPAALRCVPVRPDLAAAWPNAGQAGVALRASATVPARTAASSSLNAAALRELATYWNDPWLASWLPQTQP
jgi:hypothetical protein